MITLHDKDGGAKLGEISEDELAFLQDALEEESTTDTDYYIDSATVDMLEDENAPAALVAVLRTALQGRDGIDIQWRRK